MYAYEFQEVLANLLRGLRGRTLDMEQAKRLAEVIIAATVKEKNCGHYGCVHYAHCRYARVHISEVAFWPDMHKMVADMIGFIDKGTKSKDLDKMNTLVDGDVKGSAPKRIQRRLPAASGSDLEKK